MFSLNKFFLFFLFCQSCFGAGPIGHLYISEELFCKIPAEKLTHKEKFFLGTLLPDIRYLEVCLRENTHYEQMTLNEAVEDKSPFTAGVKFHSWVDLEREAFAEKAKIYDVIAEYKIDHPDAFLKFLEDEILFPEVVSYSIPSPQPEELQFGICKKDVFAWHLTLSLFLSFKPSTVLWGLEMGGVGFGNIQPEVIKQWNKVFKEAVADERVVAYVELLKNHFSLKLQEVSVQIPWSSP